MSNNKFFETQSNVTEAKILFLEKYIEQYLYKILLTFGKCIIFDLFCGPGKNGDKKGSPLILLDKAEKILSNPILMKLKPDAKVFIVFNDENASYVDELKSHLNVCEKRKNIEVLRVTSYPFKELHEKIQKDFIRSKLPKFFFLDPFTYSDISLNELKDIIFLNYSEILLFLPTFHAYRFTKAEFKDEHKLKKFLKEYTTKGVYDYKNIDKFNYSIKDRIKSLLNTKYVGNIKLESKKRINALFYITKHPIGMLVTNKILWDNSIDGKTIRVEDQFSLGLKDENIFNNNVLQEKLKNVLIANKTMTNIDLFDFTVIEGFLPKHCSSVLKKLQKNNQIKIEYFDKEHKKGDYVSEKNWNKKMCNISWI